MTKYLLDTTVLIDHLRGRKPAVDYITGIAQQGHQLCVCCINIAELYSGLSVEQGASARKLMDSLGYCDITSEIAMQAGAYRYEFAQRGISLSVADTLIAAAARANEAVIVTANVRDYPMKDIEVRQYLTG